MVYIFMPSFEMPGEVVANKKNEQAGNCFFAEQ